ICGLLTAFCYLCEDFISLSVYAGMFGFSISSYICLTSVILVDLLGLDKLTNAFGLLLLWQISGLMLFSIPHFQKKMAREALPQEPPKEKKQQELKSIS
ncbi:hypothetical protein ANCCEY_15814, partial [Ancylostoma ceylanicum]